MPPLLQSFQQVVVTVLGVLPQVVTSLPQVAMTIRAVFPPQVAMTVPALLPPLLPSLQQNINPSATTSAAATSGAILKQTSAIERQGDKYLCGLCGKALTRKEDVKRHQKTCGKDKSTIEKNIHAVFVTRSLYMKYQ